MHTVAIDWHSGRRPFFSVFFLSLFLLAAFFRGNMASAEDKATRKRVGEIKSQVEKMIREARFKCSYTYSEYVVETEEEAKRYDTSAGRLVVHATGSIAKNSEMTYESFTLDKLETRHPDFYQDHINVSNPELTAEYFQVNEIPNYPKTLIISEREEERKNKPGSSYLDILSYFSLPQQTGSWDETIKGARGKEPPYETFDIECRKTKEIALKEEGDTTEISVHHELKSLPQAEIEHPIDEATDDTYLFSNSYKYPVLIETVETIMHPLSTKFKVIRRECKMSDFVTLNDGCVLPQKIYKYGLITFNGYREEDIGKWIVKKWETEDLGKKEPKGADFLIKIDREPNGLLLLPYDSLLGEDADICDINDYSPDDVRDKSLTQQPDAESSYAVWARPAFLIFGGFLVAWGLFRRWKSYREKDAV